MSYEQSGFAACESSDAFSAAHTQHINSFTRVHNAPPSDQLLTHPRLCALNSSQASGQRPGSRRVVGSMGALTGAAGLRYLEYSTGGGAGSSGAGVCVCAGCESC